MTSRLLAGIVVLFCLNPFLGLLAILWIKLLAPARDERGDWLTFLIMTCYACLLQSTVRWQPGLASDWYSGGYWELYIQAGKSSFAEYVLEADKEPGWRLLNYLAHPIFGQNYFLLINSIAIGTIILTCKSIYDYWKATASSPINLIASLALLVWFSEYLNSLNNITRQLFALSLMTYAYTRTATGKQTCWWAIICACSIHTLMFIFVPLIFLKSLRNSLMPSVLIKIALVISSFGIAIAFAPTLAHLLDGLNFLSYGFQRAAMAKNLIDEWYANPASIYTSSVIIILICLELNYLEKSKAATLYFSNILMILMAVASATVVMAPALNLRLYISRFYLFPMVLPYFLQKYRTVNRLYATGIILFFGFRFFSGFSMLRGGGFFPNFGDLVSYSLLDFIL